MKPDIKFSGSVKTQSSFKKALDSIRKHTEIGHLDLSSTTPGMAGTKENPPEFLLLCRFISSCKIDTLTLPVVLLHSPYKKHFLDFLKTQPHDIGEIRVDQGKVQLTLSALQGICIRREITLCDLNGKALTVETESTTGIGSLSLEEKLERARAIKTKLNENIANATDNIFIKKSLAAAPGSIEALLGGISSDDDSELSLSHGSEGSDDDSTTRKNNAARILAERSQRNSTERK